MGFFDYYVRRFSKRNVKRSKLSRRSQVPVFKDSSINDLCDELLIKILSFLPTKVAVSTSILSKQWQFLWMWLPKLEYSSCRSVRSLYSNSSALRKFIDKNLPLHRAPVIERLSLDLLFDRHIQPQDIKRWLELAVSRYARDLYIDYYSNDDNVFPTSFYTCCNSLVILKLSRITLVDVPSTACFPSLKTLCLRYLTYQHDNDSLQGLFDVCPVLEDLSVRFGGQQRMGEITFFFPNLQRLSISVPDDWDFDGYVIDTPSLKYFKLKDWNDWRHHVDIKDMPKLKEAYVDVGSFFLKTVFGSITSVEHLTICSESPKRGRLYLAYSGGFVFNQLKHLKQCVCKESSSHLLGQLLKDSPNLRVLDISDMKDHGSDMHNEMVCWNQPSPVPECLLSSLQILNWSRYFGRPQDRDIAVYILKHARRLKKAKIIADTREHDVQNLEMITELAFSSRASSSCELVFVKGPLIWKDKEDLNVVW